MARAPSGPLGNSPRDVRDDAVGVPADDIKAPEPMRWPPKRKKVTSNTFHAKVSGGSPSQRADRKPHFRRGGFVKGFASGGTVSSSAQKKQTGGEIKKHDELPGEQKNDPFAAQNLKKAKGGVVGKRQDGGIAGPTSEDRKEGISKLSSTMKKEVSFRPGEAKAFDNPRTQSANISRYVRPGLSEEKSGFKGGGGVKKKADGGQISKPIPDDWRRLGPEPKPPPPREEPKPGFLERELEKGRAVFGPKPKADGGTVRPGTGQK